MTQGNTALETDRCIGYVSGNDTLGIPSICMGDGLEGVGNNLNNVTTFPASVLITATWDEDLNKQFGEALAQEHRSKGRNVISAPTINIVRSPLWGRAAESMSEDPYLTSRMMETNLFGRAPEFDAIDAIVDERSLYEVCFPAFKAAVQEGNAVSERLKDSRGFSGFVVTNYYFAQRTTVSAALAGLDNSQPGGSWVFGADATNQSQVTELHGGFVLDTNMVVQSSVEYIKNRGQQENISTSYSEAYPGTGIFPTVPSEMFGTAGLNISYWITRDFSGPINRTLQVQNITGSTHPSDLGTVWPEVFSARYKGTFYPNTTGLYHFSIYGNEGATLYLKDDVVVNLNDSNLGMVVQGIANLCGNTPVSIRLDYSMATSVDPGIYGVSLGVNVADSNRYLGAITAAEEADISIIFVNDEHTEGLDSKLFLELPGDQDDVISLIAAHSKKTIVVLNTKSAILMPWLDEVNAVIEAFYPGQQVGSAMAALL